MRNVITSIVGFFLFIFALNGFALKQIVVFGDSYSDNGNTYHASDNTYPGIAYYQGRFSGGPTWSEQLAKRLGINPANKAEFRNYAYGQAQVVGNITLETHNASKSWSFTIPDLAGEIDEYQKQGNIQPDHTLYFVFIGTNDFLNYVPSTKAKNQAFVKKTFAALTEQVQRLSDMGAKMIVLFNMRDLQLSPLAKQLAEKYKHHYLRKLNHMITSYNQLLQKQYGTNKQIMIYNIHEFDVMHYPTRLLTPCYVNKGNYVDPVNPVCINAAQHYFYDRIHPTEATNRLIADDLLAKM